MVRQHSFPIGIHWETAKIPKSIQTGYEQNTSNDMCKSWMIFATQKQKNSFRCQKRGQAVAKANPQWTCA